MEKTEEGKPPEEEEQELQDEPDSKPDDTEVTDEDSSEDKEETSRWSSLDKDKLLEVVQKQDSYIGQRNQEIGELRSRLDGLEQTQGMQQDYGAPPPPEQPPQQEKPPEFNWDNPSASIDAAVGKRLDAERRAQQQQQFQQNFSRAQSAYERGRATIAKNPKLFQGIEKDVENQIAQFYYPYVQQGVPVEQYLTDENMWVKAAQHIRLNRGEYDKLRVEQKPIAPTTTETPEKTTQKTSSSPVLELESEDRAFAKEMGLTDKEAKEVLESEIKRGRK